MSKNITTRTTIERLAAELKGKFAAQATTIGTVQTAANAAFKSADITNSKISFYTSTDKSGDAAATIDLPADMVLDLAKTVMVENFAFTAAAYPGATDPELEGKPVMVMAVKASATTTSYSFLNMERLMNVYSAAVGDGTTTVTFNGYNVHVNVNISAEDGNQLQKKADGLYVPAPASVDISGKADKDTDATEGNLAKFDANGNPVDSDLAASALLTEDDISDYTAAEIAALLAEDEGE